MKKKIISLFLTAALLASLNACGGGAKPAESQAPAQETEAAAAETQAPAAEPEDAGTPHAGGHLVLSYAYTPMSLFEPTAHGFGIGPFAAACLEPLAHYSRGTGEVDYRLATDMNFDQETNEFTITLRDGVKFHDGSDLNAEVMAWEFNLYMESGRGNMLGNPTGVEVVDDMTVKLIYDAYDPDVFAKVAAIYAYSKQAYEENGDEWCQTNIVGTGPYMLESYNLDSSMHCVKFDDYWGETYLDEVTMVIMADPTTSLSAFRNGEVANIALEADAAAIDGLIADGYAPTEGKYVNSAGIACYPNSLDPKSPFHKLDVRQAVFRYGVDWNGIATSVAGKYASASGQLGVDGMIIYNDDPELAYSYDPATAMQMLADAGYGDGFSTTIYTYAMFNTEAVALQASLQALNITAEVETVNNMQDVRGEGKEGIYLAAFGVNDESYPDIFTAAYVPGNIYDKVIDFSDEYVAMIAEMKSEPDIETRNEMCRALNKQAVLTDCIFQQMEFRKVFNFYQKNVHGVEDAIAYSVQSPLDIRKVWMD